MDEVISRAKAKIAECLLAAYRRDIETVAAICDEQLDRSGALLGYIRDLDRIKDQSHGG